MVDELACSERREDDGTIEPVVADTFDFDHAGEAQEMLVQRRNVGKVVLAA